MTHRPLPLISLLAMLSMVASPDAAELHSGNAVVRIEGDGCGFIDRATLHEKTILAAPDDFHGASVALALAGDGKADSLFPHRMVAVLPSKIKRIVAGAEALTAEGAYTDGTISVPFRREFRTVAGRDEIAVREQADFTRLPARYLVAEHVLRLPLVLNPDEHHRLFAFGGARRVETFRMDMNDDRRRNQSISCSRAFWPYWDLGGVLQLGESYQIWRANHADTMAYPIEQDLGAPGWADFSELDAGITVKVLEPAAAAPWAISIDARRGVFSVAAYPASQIPISGRDYGRRDFRFVLMPHASSWPATYPCELDLPTYRQFLAWLDRGGGFTHLDYVCGAIGIAAPEGRKTARQLEDLCREIILKERIQPSVVLRLLYRGDAWRMSGLVQEVLGRREPRDLAFEKWEVIAEEFLAKIRAEGVPRSPRP